MKHNKKRNIGIVYELLLNNITKNLLEGNKSKAKIATKIVETYFKKGTEIYREFRLFNALSKSQITNTHTVASILNEAKIASKSLNKKKLEREKSNLLKAINHKINDKGFYHQNIPDYRSLGLIQSSLNEWRKKEKDVKTLVDLEVKLGEHLLQEKNIPIEKEMDVNHSDRLVLKLMTEKFNKEYGKKLSKDEKTIIENYVFYHSKSEKMLNEFFKNKKQEALLSLEEFEDATDNKHLLSKLDLVREKVSTLNEEKINDINVLKFLTLTKMINEIKKEL